MDREESAFDRSVLSDSFRKAESAKSNLILEANFLHLRGEYEAAADKFALAADLEIELARQLTESGNQEKAFAHLFSGISCWGRAGDLHRALQSGEELLRRENLSPSQRQEVAAYLDSLRARMTQWMRQWDVAAMHVAD